MLALGRLPEQDRTPLIKHAIQQGAAFFLGVDPATADYQNGWGDKPSRNWWNFGLPVFLRHQPAAYRRGTRRPRVQPGSTPGKCYRHH
jgi:hypothetical protein